MTNNAAKRRIWLAATAAIIAVALLLSCALAALSYTRTDKSAGNENNIAEGENADENSLLNAQYSYGNVRPGDSGASANDIVMNIASADDLTNFLNSTYYNYGRLTQDISIASSSINATSGEVKPSTNRTLSSGKTLDGNGHTITTYFYESATLECRRVSSGLLSSWYQQYFTFQQNGTGTAVDIGNNLTAFGLSNIVSVNYGTIKNLKVAVSGASGRETVAKAIVTAPEGYNGNIGMGVVAGINFGTVENCVSTVNIPYGFYGSPVQAWSSTASHSNNKILAYNGLVAVGGIVGINKGKVLNTQINQNSDIGTYRPTYTVAQGLTGQTGDIYNDNIGSGIVGGVAGLNDGGVVNGVDYNANSGYIYNKNNHKSPSYTGVIVGLANLQTAPGGASVAFDIGYYNGSIQSGTLSIAPGSVQNIKYYFGTNFLASTEAYAFTGSRGGFMVNGDGWTPVGSYVGLIGGRVTTTSSIAQKIVTGGISFDTGKYAFRTWNSNELNSTLAFSDNSMPLLGYATSTSYVSTDYYQNLYVAARLNGQNTESNIAGDYSNDSTFLSLASVSYLWDSYVNSSGSVVSRVLYNVNFDNMPDLAGKTYSVYKESGSVEGVPGSQVAGSDDYTASSLTNGGRIEWTAGYAPQWVLMLYSLRINDFASLAHFEAFARTDKGTNNEYFAHAFADVVMLTTTNTLTSPSLTGDKVMKNWKTLDGNGQTLVVNDTVTNVSGSSVQVSVGGQTIVGISDLISVNYGTIKDLNVYYGTSSRTDTGSIISVNPFAYGRVAGINFGTISNVGVNNGTTVGDGSPTNIWTNASFGAVGLAVGVNAGTIDTLHTIVWRNLSATASTFAAAGGAVGMNDGGTLKNVIVDGVATASVSATASDSYVGGVLGAGSNYGSWTSGSVTVSAPSGATSSPFEDWTFVGKQILQTEGSNVGMLAGRIAANASLAGNGGQTIREMVVMMPQTDSAIGWFTSQKGKMSLLGTCSGTAASSGYIATDLVVGYYAYIDDASTSYISKIYTDYNMSKGDSGITTLFTTPVYSGSSAVKSVSSVSVQTENMAASAAANISFNANLSMTTQSAFISAQVATTDSVFVANDGNYAPAVKLYYDYDVNLSQSASDADTSMSKTSLEAFVSGDASSASGVGTHKILAAGANGAALTSSMSVSSTIAADFKKTRGLEGNGYTVTYASGPIGGIPYVNGSDNLTAAGVLASVNSSLISNITVAISAGVTTNMGGAFAFGGVVGVNLGTLSGVTVALNGNINIAGGGISYVGGVTGINRGAANGSRTVLTGSITAENSGGTLIALGGVIGLQDYAGLSDVQVTGYGGSLTAVGNSYAGGVIGIANASGQATVAGIAAVGTTLTNIANAAYGMNITALSGYKGLIAGVLSDGDVADNALSGIAAFYPDDVADYAVPWTSDSHNATSMYGKGTAGSLEGLLFRVSDYSKDGAAEFLTDRTISVNGASKSFTFNAAQITSLDSISFDTKYYYYGADGTLTTDATYTGAPTQSGNIYTTAINGSYQNSEEYVPTLDVFADYTVIINNNENQQLVDFMRGESQSGNYGSYAGAHTAKLAGGASFSLDGGTADQRSESLGTKVLVGSGNTVSVSGTLPTAVYDGIQVSGGFFAVNNASVSGIDVAATADMRPSAGAFGMLAGANAGALTDVAASMVGLSMTGGIFGALAGINTANVNGALISLSGTYTINSANVFAGGAIGVNSGAVSQIEVAFDGATLYANPSSTGVAGGVVGMQNGGSLVNAGTSGNTVSMNVSSGSGYIGGVAGIINTSASESTVVGQLLAPSTMSGVYVGAYPSYMNGSNVYKGLISGASVGIAQGSVTGASAHYYEKTSEAADFKIPWFSEVVGTVSMYGYAASGADASYANGVLFKVSDYSDDGNADFVSERKLSSSASSAQWSFPLSAFNGATSLDVQTVYRRYSGGEQISAVLADSTYGTTGDFTYVAAAQYVNGTGDYVPVIDFLATYSVNIYSGTEGDVNNTVNGIADSMLYCFIDGTGNNSLYAGAKTGVLAEEIIIFKPANGYITMSASKVLEGNGKTVRMAYSYGDYVLQLDNRESDNASSGSGGYVQIEAGGSATGAAGGLIAVNYGTVQNLTVVHRTYSSLIGSYSLRLLNDAAAGVLVGANFGTVSGVTYYNETVGSIAVSADNAADVIFGGVIGINAEGATATGISVVKMSVVNFGGAGEGVYGGAIGSNYGTAQNVSVTTGTEISQSDYMSRLDATPLSTTDYLTSDTLAVWGGAIGYNSGVLIGVSVLAHANYGMSAGGSNLAAGGVIGINDGGEAVGIKATGWGGFFVYSSMIRMPSLRSVFVGGLAGAMNADGAATIGFLNFDNATGATLSDSVFALSGGMVTMDSFGTGIARYGYVTGALAAVYGNIPAGAVSNTFWFIADKLQSVEGDDAERLPAFHGGNNSYPTYISAFGMAPSDWLTSEFENNSADFATGSYGFNLVDSDDNPVNYLTMDATISGGVLTLTVHKPTGIQAYYGVADFSSEITGSGGTGTGTVGTGGGADQILTVSNAGNTGTGYVTFSFESTVLALTDSQYVQYMILSFLSTKPCGTVDGNYAGYYSYTTVDGVYSRSLDDAFYRVYQLWSGATEMYMSGTNKTVNITTVPAQPLVLGKGKLFDGGQSNGYTINVTSSFLNNIAAYTFGGDLDGVSQKYLVVSEFIAVNYGTFTNAAISISGTDGGYDITRNAQDVIEEADRMGIDTSGLTGFIYGMLVGVNEGTISHFDDYSFDRTINLISDAGSKYNSIFGGMVGAQSGAEALIDDVGHITFGTESRSGGITMSGEANLISAGGVVGIAIDGEIRNLGVMLTANSDISVEAKHNSAAVGGVVGDLRGKLSDVTFESQYQSVMKINNTNTNGAAALGNLAGVINTFEFAAEAASIERVKVIGIGYLYNGIDEDGTVTTQSTNLYTAGVVALGANYDALTAESTDPVVKQIVSAYGEIRPAKLDSIYIDFEGYVRAKANTRVGMISARMLDGITETSVNVNTDYLKNLIWQASYEGDGNWTSNENYADYTETFGSNAAVAIMGYAPVTIGGTDSSLRGQGMRLWLTNNLYTARSSVADMVVTWASTGNLNVQINSNMSWQSISVASVYYDETGADASSKYVKVADYGEIGSQSSVTVYVSSENVLAAIANSAAQFGHGFYMFKVTYKEVYIYNQKELIAFFSLPTSYDNLGGGTGNQYYSEVDSIIGTWTGEHGTKEEYRNAEIGILANDISINYGLVRVTMSPNKILDGNGNTVTFDESGTLVAKPLYTDTDDKNSSILMPAGVVGANSEYDANYKYGSVNASFARYIGGTNVLSEYNINTINTLSKVGIRVGGMFVGRNLGTIQNINFVVPNSVQMSNEHYGTFTLTGIVCAVNAGTIDNCTVTINENVKVGTYRYTATSTSNSNEVDTNKVSNPWINTAAVSGGIAGLQYGTSDKPSYISNSTVTLSEGSEFRAESQVSSFYWLSRRDNIYAYAGGVVGWLTSDSTIYNITVNGSGTVTAWGELDMDGSGTSMSRGRKVSGAGAIVGLNSDHQTYSMSENDGEYGIIDGVICNWNGAAFYLTTSSDNIYLSGRMNYYMGAQLVGIAEQNTLNNIYFMYGIDQYQTFHQDNWYYGDNVAARQASADFAEKYDYIVSRSVELLSRDKTKFSYDQIYAIVNDGSSSRLTLVAYRNNGDVNDVIVNRGETAFGNGYPEFNFTNYANYQDAVDKNLLGGTNFSLYVAPAADTFVSANAYFTRITATLDVGEDKYKDYVGARAAAMITNNGSTDWNSTFKPNNVYLYEVGFGVDENNGTELDMNDPDTSAYLSFQTTGITSDVEVNVTLKTDNMGAQFVWKTIEQWSYSDGSQYRNELLYYSNVTSLEQAKQNNSFVKIFDRDNDGSDFTFTYVMGMAIRIAMDENRYYYDEDEGVFYDSYAKIYDGSVITDPLLYYADEEGNKIESLGDVSASLMSPSYYIDNVNGDPVSVQKTNTDKAGAYRIRISFSSEGGENSKVNTTNRTMMFSEFDHIDIYTVVLPKGIVQNGVFVSKTYDGTKNYAASTTQFTGALANDEIALDTGTYTKSDAGAGNIFTAAFSDFTYKYASDGVINQVTISLFDGSGDTSNYAPATSSVSGSITLGQGATAFYKKPSGPYSGEIYRKELTSDDLVLYVWGEVYHIGNTNNKVYDAMVEYNTEAFEQNSTIMGQALRYASSGGGYFLETDGYASNEKLRFYITFRSGSEEFDSVKNYGVYNVYINIDNATNFAFNNGGTLLSYLPIGSLSITEYAIETANVTYVIQTGYLEKTFNNNQVIPFTFNPDNLRITAQNGYEVQPDEYSITVGNMYTTVKGSSSTASAKDVGEYDIYFRISDFTCPLGNYTLEDMTVTFVDSNGDQISYFVLPKEIRTDSVSKEFDNTTGADASYTTFEYVNNYGPVSGTNDVFAMEFDSIDAGADIDVNFVNVQNVTLNGKTYATLQVVSGNNAGKNNYYVTDTVSDCGNITPVLVTIESVSMVYSNSINVDYRKEGTSVVIKDSDNDTVDIYPLARFDNKSAGSGKTVTLVTSNMAISGKTYALLENSTYVSTSLPVSGVGYAGNYYVEKTNWNVGEIVKNTLSRDDISGNITVIQTNGAQTINGTEYLFENLSRKSYTYHYGYYVGFEINSAATIIEDDPLSDHVSVEIVNTTNGTNGYVGVYTLTLTIVSEDYEWDTDVLSSDITVTDLRINQQELNATNLTASLSTTVYTYSSIARTLLPSLVVTDKDGRTMSLENGDIGWIPSTFTNNTQYFAGGYSNGSKFPVGDYSFSVTPRFVGDDAINYIYMGGYACMLEFSVIPYQITSIRASKEFDNTTSFTTQGNEAVFTGSTLQSTPDQFTPSGSFSSKSVNSNIRLNLNHVTVTVNGMNYDLLLDVSGRVTNNTYNASNMLGTINKYTISASELNTYILGWVKDLTERQQLSLKSGSAVLEYRSDLTTGYSSEHFLFSASSMKYNFVAATAENSLNITQNGSSVATLYFTVKASNGSSSFAFAPSSAESYVLPAGTYTVTLELSSSSFALDTGAGNGQFTVEKQEVSGGGAEGSANVFITLGGDFSYTYGESGFNMPTAEDAKFVYTINIIDKYTGKISATYTQADAVIGMIEYTSAPDSDEFFTSLSGPLYIGGYYVWASDFADEILVNYKIPENSRIAVYTAGVTVPEAPDPEEGETGGEESGEQGGAATLPSLPAETAYFILPRTLNIESLAKTYDGTDSFTGAVLTSDALAGDGITSASISGVYASPNANYDSTGTLYIDGNKGSDFLLVNVVDVTVNGTVYHALSADGITGNYCLAGEPAEGVLSVAGAKIMRKAVNASSVSLTSDTFETVYGASEDPELPDVTASFDGATEIVFYTADNVVFKKGGEVVTPAEVGGYEMYLTGVAFDNYEVAGGLSEVLVNAIRATSAEEGEEGEDGSGSGEGGDQEEEPDEIAEAFTYYIVPKEVLISGIVKFYDKGVELVYYADGEQGVSADVTVTDTDGNPLEDGEGQPVILRVQGRFADASAGTGKDVFADFTPFGYVVNFEETNVAMYYRLLVVAEDGTTNVASNYCIGVSDTVLLPGQFDEGYVPEYPENDDTPVINNGLVYNMTLIAAGTVIPAPLTIENVSKVYDGNYEITSATVSGWLSGDEEMSVAKWRYSDKDAGTAKIVGVETDGTGYVYGDVTYYAVYVIAGGEKTLSDYGVAASTSVSVEETVTGEDGTESTVDVIYAVLDGIGEITPFTITNADFSAVSVAGVRNTEYSSRKSYSVADVCATVSALGFTATAVNVDGTMTVTFDNGDELTFTASLGGSSTVQDAGNYTVTITLAAGGNYAMAAPYSFTFVITKQTISEVYVITGSLSKVYDGTDVMPAYSTDAWTVYAVDKDGVLIDMTAFGEIDLGSAAIVFVRYNEEEMVNEYYTPVNAVAAGENGYPIYVEGVALDSANYLFEAAETALGCASFDQSYITYEQAYYRIDPKVVNISDGAFASKKFDGAFSLSVDGGVQGETVVVGDSGGLNASLAGVYGTLSVRPYVKGVAIAEDALNAQSVPQNYALYYDGAPVDDATVIGITNYEVVQADVLVAERENGKYGVGLSGLQGLDFLFAKSDDIGAEAQQRITERLMTGETWTGGSFDSSSDFAKLNQAVAAVFELYVNNGENTVMPALTDKYVFDSFSYVAQGNAYVLAFSFAGIAGYDENTATDRYTFVVQGNSDSVKSTNYSTTSSELESGQLTGAAAGEGIAVSTEKELKEAIKNGSTFYLTNSIYGVDMSDADASAFTGVFDGRGYTVSLTGYTGKAEAKGMLVSVNEGTIRNLVVKLMPDQSVSATCFGGVAGINNGVISDVSVEIISSLTVTGATYAGGVAGVNSAGAELSQVSFVFSADVSAAGAKFGGIAGNNQGSISKAAVRVNESAGSRNYSVSAAGAGYVAGNSDGTADGVIVAVEGGRLSGVSALWNSGSTAAANVYSYTAVDGVAGGQLALLDPYTEGYIGYYFATQADYSTDGMLHNELTAADEYNKSYYNDYSDGNGYVAIETIASYNRFIWDAYGVSYRTVFGDGYVGSSLNRVVALFAAGDVAAQFEGTTVITTGVNAFTAAIGVRGGNVEVEGDVETSIKEVIYTGVAQVYSVNITVTNGGVSETKTLSVGGTDVGYYSKASLEGIIGGGAGGETIGDVTYDAGSRTEYTFSGEGTKVANGIALVIYPKQIDASATAASKYYDTTAQGTLTVMDGEDTAGSVDGYYYDDNNVQTSQVADASKFGFAGFDALTRSVLAKEGVLYGIVEKITGEGDQAVVTYETEPIRIGSGDLATDFTTSVTVGEFTAHELMIAYSRLTDESRALELLGEEQLVGFEFVDVYNLTASVTGGSSAVIGSAVSYRPVLAGEGANNYSLYSADWLAPADMTVGADQATFPLQGYALSVAGEIIPVDLGITAVYTAGKDQSYNAAMIDPSAVAGTTVTVTQEEAAALGISAKNYAALVAEVAAGIDVSFGDDFFDGLVEEGVLEKRADGKYYTTAEYSHYGTAMLPDAADGGNYVVSMSDVTVTFRYFGTTVKDGETYYTLATAEDYGKWIDNEGGTADYYKIDILLVDDVDFGGKLTDMLAWRDEDGNVVGFGGTFDGDGYAFVNMLIDRDGSAALFERIDEGAVVRNLTLADTIVISAGAGSVAGGIAVDNYGTIENCAFEGTVAASSKTGGIAATNYGTIVGGVSVSRAYADEGGTVEGIAENAALNRESGTSDGVSITESRTESADGFVENTVIEHADGSAADWKDAEFDVVIKAYVFDETYVRVDGSGLFVTDNFIKLNAVDKLFGWVGADAVTSASQKGFYGTMTLQ